MKENKSYAYWVFVIFIGLIAFFILLIGFVFYLIYLITELLISTVSPYAYYKVSSNKKDCDVHIVDSYNVPVDVNRL